MAKEVRKIMTLHKPMSIPSNCSLVTVLVTTLENHQSVCLDMNRVVCCKPLFLFFSSKYTQLCSILTLRVNAINGLLDKGMKSIGYKTTKGINRMTLNHLVKGSNPLRPIDSTTIQGFTLDRFLDRQENHLETNHNAYKNYRNIEYNGRGIRAVSAPLDKQINGTSAPCQPTHATQEESVKIIRVEECMTEDCYPACPYCSEVRVDGGDAFVCDHPESVGKDIEPCIESIHPDCPLPDADRTSGQVTGQEEGEDADL